MSLPHVTAVMVTGKDPRRRPFMLAAVRAFQEQTYPERDLLIVRDDAPNDEDFGPNTRTIHVSEKKTLGELRNVGLNAAVGDYVLQWDDDDFYAPWRIELQMQVARKNPEAAVTLSHQVRYSFVNNCAFVWGNPRQGNGKRMGIPGTILHPRTNLLYAAAGRHEDSWFLESWECVAICDNSQLPHTYLRFAHDSNTWSASHIMQNMSRRKDERRLSAASVAYLESVLQSHYRETGAASNISDN